MTNPTPPSTAARPPRGVSLWPRLLALFAFGGGLASPLVVAAVVHWTDRDGVEVAGQFLTALRAGDAQLAASFLTPEARAALPEEAVRRLMTTSPPVIEGWSFTPGAPYRRPDSLAVPFVVRPDANAPGPGAGGGEGQVVLKRAGGLWRVSGLQVSATPWLRQGVDLDFERPPSALVAAPQSPPSPEETTFEQVGAVTPEEFAAAWQTDVDAADVPAIDLLRKLAAEVSPPPPVQTANTPAVQTFPPEVGEAVRRRVSLHMHKVSRWEAIEEVCRQTSVLPDFSMGRLRFQRGKRSKRPTGVALAGPFLMQGSVSEDVPNAAGQLQLALRVAPLPPKIAALFAAVPLSGSLRGVTAPSGQNLFFAEKGMQSGVPNFVGTRAPGDFFVYLPRESTVVQINVPLKNLLRDVDAVAEVKVSLRAALPREIHALRLDPVAVGGGTAGGGVRLTLEKIVPPGETAPNAQPAPRRYEFRAESPAGLRLCWLAHLAGGGTASGWTSLPGHGVFTAAVSGESERFDFKVWGGAQDVAWDFTLRDLKLEWRPPRLIEPLRFEGHAAPVGVSEASLTENGVELRIANHCGKDIERVELTIAYRDGEGRVLREVARKVGTFLGEGVDLTRTVAPDELLDPDEFPTHPTADWSVQDPAPAPDGARSVTASVTRALFKDGTTWAP